MSDKEKRAMKVKSTRKINRRCCRNCAHFCRTEVYDSYEGDKDAWGCSLINYKVDTEQWQDELYIMADDLGLHYLTVCDEFEMSLF